MQKQIMKKQSLKNQNGMTLISWVVVIAFIGFHFMLAIRIVPLFADDQTVSSVWKNMENDSSLAGKSPKMIRKGVMRKLRVNNVTALKVDDIKVKRGKGFVIVSVEYEPRGKIIGKLDFIATFKHEVKIKTSN